MIQFLPRLFYMASTIMYGVLLVVLFTAEKEPRYIVDEGDIIQVSCLTWIIVM